VSDLDRTRIEELLRALDRALERRGATADIYILGGGAIALGFDAERSTRDLNAVFAPASEVRSAASDVAEEFDLAADWINDAAKCFLPPTADDSQRVVFESPHLRVCVAGAEHLLAMKVASSRVEQDRDDLELLIRTLGITSAEQALDVARQCLGPTYPIPPRAQYLLTEIFEG
jgi:hypothetical protein